MEDFLGILIPTIIVTVMVSFYLLSRHLKRKRTMTLGLWASQRGYDFFPEADDVFSDRFADVMFLQEGDSRITTNRAQGTYKGHDFQSFDFIRARRRRGKRDRDYRQSFSIVIFQLPFEVTALEIRPETMNDKFADLLGFNDIDFESEEFSSRYSVCSPDSEWARSVIDDKFIDFMLRVRPMEVILLSGRSLCIFARWHFEPIEITRALEIGVRLIEALPQNQQSHSTSKQQI